MPRQRPLSQKPETPGSRLRLLREAKGLSQKVVAKAVYATQPAVSQWENDVWLPSRATQDLLATVLGTTRAFLFAAADADDAIVPAVGQ